MMPRPLVGRGVALRRQPHQRAGVLVGAALLVVTFLAWPSTSTLAPLAREALLEPGDVCRLLPGPGAKLVDALGRADILVVDAAAWQYLRWALRHYTSLRARHSAIIDCMSTRSPDSRTSAAAAMCSVVKTGEPSRTRSLMPLPVRGVI